MANFLTINLRGDLDSKGANTYLTTDPGKPRQHQLYGGYDQSVSKSIAKALSYGFGYGFEIDFFEAYEADENGVHINEYQGTSFEKWKQELVAWGWLTKEEAADIREPGDK